MTWTRRKLLGGALGVSIGGLVATCQEPARTPLGGAHPLPPAVCNTPQPVIAVPAVPPATVRETVVVALQPPIPALPPTPAEAPKIAPVAVQPGPPTLDVPKLDPPALPAPALKLEPPPPSKDPVIVPPAPRLDLPTVTAEPTKLAPPMIDIAPVRPIVPDAPPPGATEPKIPSPAVPVSRPKAEPVPAKPVPAEPADPSVKVVVRLGDGSPKFEVMSGGDVVLKVTCESVDVRSAGAENAGTTPLVASGKVRFSASWCEGTCDSLTVQPDNKNVVLTGVRARSKHGKAETEIVAQTMKFRLGVDPEYSVGSPAGGSMLPPSRD